MSESRRAGVLHGWTILLWTGLIMAGCGVLWGVVLLLLNARLIGWSDRP